MQIWKRSIDLDEINKNFSNTLAAHLGIIISKVESNSLQGIMPVKEHLKQPYGILHGGASVVLAETLGSLASNLCIEEGFNTVGLDINANHLKAVTKGEICGETYPIHIGRSTHVWEIKLFNQGRMSCISRLTMAILKK